jgi:hypothetical protein
MNVVVAFEEESVALTPNIKDDEPATRGIRAEACGELMKYRACSKVATQWTVGIPPASENHVGGALANHHPEGLQAAQLLHAVAWAGFASYL